MNEQQKYLHAMALFKAMGDKKIAQNIIDQETEILVDYVAHTGDKLFVWETCHLTYVNGTSPKQVVDAKAFMELAKSCMSAADYAACLALATKPQKGRKPYFR